MRSAEIPHSSLEGQGAALAVDHQGIGRAVQLAVAGDVGRPGVVRHQVVTV